MKTKRRRKPRPRVKSQSWDDGPQVSVTLPASDWDVIAQSCQRAAVGDSRNAGLWIDRQLRRLSGRERAVTLTHVVTGWAIILNACLAAGCGVGGRLAAAVSGSAAAGPGEAGDAESAAVWRAEFGDATKDD